MAPTTGFVGASALYAINENESAMTPTEARAHRERMASASAAATASASASPSAFAYDAGLHLQEEEMASMRSQRSRSRTDSRFGPATTPSSAANGHLPAAPWTVCGHRVPALTLRVLTSLLLLPALLTGLLLAPDLVTVWCAVVLVCVGSYEYAWLAFRLHYQLLTTYNWYERAPADGEAMATMAPGEMQASEDPEGMRFHFQSFASEMSQPSTLSLSDWGTQRSGGGGGGSGGGGMDHDQQQQPQQRQRQRQRHDSTIDFVEASARAGSLAAGADPLAMLQLATAGSAATSLASACCGGHEWLAKLMLTAVYSSLWVVVAHFLLPTTAFPVITEVPPLMVLEIPQLAWLAIALAALCAFSTPNLRFAASLLIQTTVFFGMTLNALTCPLYGAPSAAIRFCEKSFLLLSPMELFAVGALLLVMMRALTTSSPADMVLVTLLDLLGYLLITGNAALLLAVVDLADAHATYATVLLLFLAVVWSAHIASATVAGLMHRFRIRRHRLLPPRIVARVDWETWLVGIAVGQLVMALAGGVVWSFVESPMWLNAVLALAAVVTSQFTSLFYKLVLRAAGVAHAGRVMPGFGGVLDAASHVVVAAAVFTKLYVVVMHYAPVRTAVAAALSVDSAEAVAMNFTMAGNGSELMDHVRAD